MIQNIAILSIGNELLNGKILNTNTHTIAQFLTSKGFSIERSLTIPDTAQALFDALDFCADSDAVIITGGLGPTPDDQTRNYIATYLKRNLILFPEAEAHLATFFNSDRAHLFTQHQKIQALFPTGAALLANPHGTALGFTLIDNKRHIFVTPGVPYEMEPMLKNEIYPILKHHAPSEIYSREILTMNIGEAQQTIILDDLLLPDHITFSSLPEMDGLRLSLTTRVDSAHAIADVNSCMDEIITRFVQHGFGSEIISRDGTPLIATLHNICCERTITVATVESCTGGNIGSLLTSLPGSSAYYMGGYVTYANALKTKCVQVSPVILEQYGAVSEQCVREMARNGKINSGADFCIAVSGIAGPDGGTPEKPVGLVWMAIAHPNGVDTFKKNFRGDRNCLRTKVSFYLINELRKKILTYTN